MRARAIMISGIAMISLLGIVGFKNIQKETKESAISSYKNEVAEEYVKIIPMNLEDYDETIKAEYLIKGDSDKQIVGSSAEKVNKDKDSIEYKYPQSTVVAINIEVENPKDGNSILSGTGVLIGPDTVLTCAHIFYPDYEVTTNNGEKCRVEYKDNIKEVRVCGDLQETSEGISIGNSVLTTANEVYINSKYMEEVGRLEHDISNGVISTNTNEYNYIIEKYRNDVAVIKLSESIGNELGWIGILPFQNIGSRKWATVYGFPTVVPKLPELNVMASYLKKDLTRTQAQGYDKTRGVIISLASAIDALENDGSDLNKRFYSGLMKKNGYEMYRDYAPLEMEDGSLLSYKLSTYHGQSGSPLIQSIYNASTGRYDSYTSGIHLGYCIEDGKENKEYGDLYMYVDDYTGKIIDFKDSYDEETPMRDAWTVRMGANGKNYGRQMDYQLFNYLVANNMYPKSGYIPEDRKER